MSRSTIDGYRPGCIAIATGFIFLLHVALWLLMFPTMEEDAFIYLRLARNIADGWGYVFNIGGERVESGTSLIWMGLLALSLKLPLTQILSVKLLGLVFSLATIGVAGRLAFFASGSRIAALLAMGSLSVSYPMAYWSAQGLETPLVAFLLSFLVLSLLDPRYRAGLWPVSIALVLVRPEGIVYLSIVMCWGIWQWHRGESGALWRAVAASLAAVLALMVCTLWRLWYFGDLVVHPFYFKSDQLGAVKHHVLLFANQHLRIDLLLLPVFAAFLRKRLPASAGLMLFAFVVQLAWHSAVFDHFPFERHLVPGLSFLYVLLAISVCGLVRGMRARMGVAGAVFLAVPLLNAVQYPSNPLVVLGGLWLDQPAAYSKAVAARILDPTPQADDLVDNFLRDNLQMLSLGHNWESAPGLFIAAAYPKGSVIAFHEMGQTPYYAGQDKRIIDMVGLTDRYMGYFRFTALSEEGSLARTWWKLRCAATTFFRAEPCPELRLDLAVDYILAQQPDVILIQPYMAAVFGPKLALLALQRDERFLRLYGQRYVVDKHIAVYERVDKNFAPFTGSLPGVEFRRAP